MADRLEGTVTSGAQYNPLLKSQGGGGKVSGGWGHTSDSGLSLALQTDAQYLYRFDHDRYDLIFGEGSLGFSKGIFSGEGGLLSSVTPWMDRRLLGARLRVGRPWINVEAFGGRQVMEVWQEGLPGQRWDHWLSGATVSGGGQILYGHVTFQEERAEGGALQHREVSATTRTDAWHGISAFGGGTWFLEPEGYDARVGLQYRSTPVSASVTYIDATLPPFFEVFKDPPRSRDQRAAVAVSARVHPSIVIMTSGEVGSASRYAATLGCETPYGGVVGVWRRDEVGNAGGGMVHGRIPLFNERLSVVPYGAVYQETDALTASDGGVLIDGGVRVNTAMAQWLGLTAAGGCMQAPHVGRGCYITASITMGAGWNGHPPADRSPLGASFPVHGSDRFAPVLLRRRFGLLMREVASGFSHKDHLTDTDIQIDGHQLLCATCHTPQPLLRVQEKTIESVCSDCHEEELAEIFGKLTAVQHPGHVGDDCVACHGPFDWLPKKGTGGVGAIIVHPHRSSVRGAGAMAWQDHGRQQDADCAVCHSGQVQYADRRVLTCESCHDRVKPTGTIPQTRHPEGWRVGHIFAAKTDLDACRSCHSTLSACRSCHQEEHVLPKDMHHSGWMRKTQGQMHHGKIALRSGGAACGVCHPPQRFAAIEHRQAVCGGCH